MALSSSSPSDRTSDLMLIHEVSESKYMACPPRVHLRPLPGFEVRWRDLAACKNLGDYLFFSVDGERTTERAGRERAAKAICATCPVLPPCREYATATGESHGIWGGLSESERAPRNRRNEIGDNRFG